MGTRLYVGNLSYNVTEPELREAFGEGGRNVVEVKIVMDRETGRPRGPAYVAWEPGQKRSWVTRCCPSGNNGRETRTTP